MGTEVLEGTQIPDSLFNLLPDLFVDFRKASLNEQRTQHDYNYRDGSQPDGSIHVSQKRTLHQCGTGECLETRVLTVREAQEAGVAGNVSAPWRAVSITRGIWDLVILYS